LFNIFEYLLIDKYMNQQKFLLLFCVFFVSIFGFNLKVNAQGTSNKGTDFWLGYGTHISHGASTPETMVLYITADVNTTATITVPSIGFTQSVNITANNVQTVTIPSAAHLNSEGKFTSGIHVTALKPIIMYSHIYQNTVSGATLVLPVNTLGKDYYSINYKQVSNSNNSASYFFVVAIEDATQVEITPSSNTQGGWLANTKYTISLNKGEIYNVLGAYTNANGTLGVDLTGSRIKSVSSNGVCKKIAVFSGSSKISVSCLNTTTGGSADNLFQQVYPTSTWGKNFITVPLKDRDFDVFRILKSDPSAVVSLNGVVVPDNKFVNSFYYEFESQSINNISSDKPIQVAQYSVTQGRGINCTTITGDVGDPEMIFLNPLEQTLTNITMYSTPNAIIQKHFINVVVKNEGVVSFKLDGNSATSNFKAVAGSTTHSYAQLPVAVGTHTLSANAGFNAIAYGFGNADSYGYAAGANLTAFGIEPITSGSQESVQSGCIGTPYDLTLKLPYPAVEIYLDKLDGNGLQTIPVVLKSQTTIGGETIYVYTLINNLIYSLEKTYSFRVRAIKPTIDDCGTGDEFDYDFILNPKPIANFIDPEKKCLGSVSSFSAQTAVGSTFVDYLWDFNGEGISKIQNPVFTFSTAGIKTIKFSAKSNDNCWSDIVEKKTEIFSLPIVDFTNSSVSCEKSNAIVFTDLSTSASGNIIKWDWDFGDGSAPLSTINNTISHVYTVYGIYKVKLTVTTSDGCSNSLIRDLIIYPLPNTNFDASINCYTRDSTVFNNKSTIPYAINLFYTWDFNDPSSGIDNISTLNNPTHKFSKAGVFTVKLTAISDVGCQFEMIKTVTVNALPIANFNANAQTCLNDITNFSSINDVNGPVILEYLWDFNGEATSTLKDPNYTFSAAGLKLIKYTVKSDAGCWSDITQKTIEIMNLPTADFSNSLITCEKGEIQFTDLSSTIAQNIVKWDWEFGDPSSASNSSIDQNPKHTFLIAGSYSVKLKVTTNLGCVQTISKQILVHPLPTLDFEGPDICLNDASAIFVNKSSISDGSTLSYTWDFGDPTSGINNTSTLKNPQHIYSAAANYQVKLTATNEFDCVSEIIKTFTVNGSTPKADFAIQNKNNLCSDSPVIFEDLAGLDFGQLTKIEWYFDIDNHLNDPAYHLVDLSPNLRSATAKTYTFNYPIFNTPINQLINVKMKVFSGVVCESEVIKTILLKAVPNVVFNPIPDVCEEVTPYLITAAKEITGFSGLGVYSGKGIAANGLFNPAVAGAGTHEITYTFTGVNGCENSKKQNITVFPSPYANAGFDEIILVGGQVQLFSTFLGNNLKFKWTPSLGLDHDDIFNPVASPKIDTKYTLMVTNADSCVYADDILVKVLQYPEIPNTFTPNNDGVNDTWVIKYLSSYPSSRVTIFNREGQEIYKSINNSEPWDGKHQGRNLPNGVYYYLITVNNGLLKYSGSITILR
jgi:gliding motility-associated-like protein